MIEPSSVADDPDGVCALRFFPKSFQSGENALRALLAGNPAVFNADSNRGQAETHRRDAARGIGPAAVAHQTIVRIRFLPEKIEGSLLKQIQKLSVIREFFRRSLDDF